MDELKKLREMLEGIQQNLAEGVISKATFDEKVAEIQAKMDDLASKQKEIMDAMAKRANAMNGLQDEKEKFSILRAVRGIFLHDWKNGGEFEKQVMEEYAQKIEQKAMSGGTGSAGGFLIPPQAITQIIELLRANTTVIEAGASVMTDLNGYPVEMPKQTGGATAYWTAENSAITASDLTLGQLTMTPHQLSALVKLSNRLIKNSNPGAEQLVREDIAIVMALALDLAALRGSGAGSEPRGIANTSSIGTYTKGTNGGRLTFVDMDAIMGVIEDANAARGNLGYIMNPKVKRLLKQERVAQFSTDTGGAYVILPMSDQMLSDALGYQFKTTTQIPTNLTKGIGTNLTEVYCGNWRELLIAQWGGMEITSSNVAGDASGGAFSANQTWIRAILDCDIAVRHPASFCLCNDAQSQA